MSPIEPGEKEHRRRVGEADLGPGVGSAAVGGKGGEVDPGRDHHQSRLDRRQARRQEGRGGVVVRGHDDGVGGVQDERQDQPPVPLEEARLPVHPDHIHLILHHQRRATEEAAQAASSSAVPKNG